jgi:hypothetical protein
MDIKRIAQNVFMATSLLTLSGVASAQTPGDAPTAVLARILAVEPSAVPNSVSFKIDAPVANCPAQRWILWDGGVFFVPGVADEATRRESVKNMTATLIAQLHALPNAVRVYAANSASSNGEGCRVLYLHALSYTP